MIINVRIIFTGINPRGRHNNCKYLCIQHRSISIHKTNIQFSSVQPLSRVRLFVTPWTVAHQAPLSMGFSRQEYWSGLPFPYLGDLPDPGIKAGSFASQADSLPSELQGSSRRTEPTLKNWEGPANMQIFSLGHKTRKPGNADPAFWPHLDKA